MSTVIKPLVHLKPSRLQFGCQLSCVSIVLILSFLALHLLSWLLLCSASLIITWLYRQYVAKKSLVELQQLDQNEWTLVYRLPAKHRHSKKINVEQVERVCLRHALDYGLCLLFFPAATRAEPLLIWRDQVDAQTWKYLKSVHLQLQSVSAI